MIKTQLSFVQNILVQIILVAYLLVGCNNAVKTIDLPAIPIETDQVTRLISGKAQLNGDIKIFMPEESFKFFWVENWKSPEQSIQWNIDSKEGNYQVSTLVQLNNVSENEKVILELTDGKNSIQCSVSGNGWQRCSFDKLIKLSSGISTLTLRILSPGQSDDFNIHLSSLEIVTPALYTQLQQKIKKLYTDARWMSDLKYGFFFHWNSCSMPRQGEPKSYEEAVKDFDADAFAKMVNDCGGQLVFFTTSWAEYYFPAPLQTIDNIIPGRTASRDLILALSDALGKYGIKLILYYHTGHGDKEWWDKQNYSREHPEMLFSNLEQIMGEISDRYGSKIAGLWLDDGMGYYPNGANFEKITTAVKRGNPNMVVCYNPWIFPKFTEFQDFYAGEMGLSEKSAGIENPYLPVGGDGRFTGGPHQGLQATYCGLLEPGDWTHIYKDTEIPAPLLSTDELTTIIRESNKRRNLPMMNVRIYQDGTISPQTYQLLKEVKEQIYNK